MAIFYMTPLENNNFDETVHLKPTIYTRYVDDCFIVTYSVNALLHIKEKFPQNSVLNFTHELGTNQILNFIDVHVDDSGNKFVTSVYKKPTSTGIYLNAKSEYPDRYLGEHRKSAHTPHLQNLFHLAKFHYSIQILKQSLINNGYTILLFDQILKK